MNSVGLGGVLGLSFLFFFNVMMYPPFCSFLDDTGSSTLAMLLVSHKLISPTMDRSESKKDNDRPLKLVDPKYKLNVGNMEVRYPVLSQHPKYGSRYMVLDEQPVKEFYGTAKPTIEENVSSLLFFLDVTGSSTLVMLLVSHKLISPQMYLTN
jgi:hypothetical protein